MRLLMLLSNRSANNEKMVNNKGRREDTAYNNFLRNSYFIILYV